MKKLVLLLALAIPTLLWAEESEWVNRATACFTRAEADALIPELKRGAGAETDLCLGIVYHNLAVAKPVEYADRAIALLEVSAKADAKTARPLAQGYWGSALTLRASLLVKKGDFAGAADFVKRGCDLIDQAVAAAPGADLLRLLRAESGLSVSKGSPFNRYAIVEKDILFLEARIDRFPGATRALIYFLHGELSLALKKTADALRFLEQAVRAAPDSRAAGDARKMLSLLEE